jgi:hypothetical protein
MLYPELERPDLDGGAVVVKVLDEDDRLETGMV